MFSDKETEIDNPLPVGFKKDVIDATKIDLSQKLASSEAISLLPETASEREEDLIRSWGDDVFKITSPDTPDQYYLGRTINQRKIVIVASLDSEATLEKEKKRASLFGSRRNSSYRVTSIFVSGPDIREGIEMLDRTPENIGVLMDIHEGDTPSKNASRKQYSPGSDYVGGDVIFDSIRSFDDIATFAHESGHAEILGGAEMDKKILLNVARGVRDRGIGQIELNDVKALKDIEVDSSMSIGEALRIVGEDEREADTHTDMFLSDTKLTLGITDEERNNILERREKNYQSYDQSNFGGDVVTLLFPDAPVSDRARAIQKGHEDDLFAHYELTRQLIEVYEQNVENSQELIRIDTDDGKYKMMYNGTYLHVDTPRGKRHYISLTGANEDANSDQKQERVHRFSLRDFEQAEKTVGDIAYFVEIERKLLQILSDHFEK